MTTFFTWWKLLNLCLDKCDPISKQSIQGRTPNSSTTLTITPNLLLEETRKSRNLLLPCNKQIRPGTTVPGSFLAWRGGLKNVINSNLEAWLLALTATPSAGWLLSMWWKANRRTTRSVARLRLRERSSHSCSFLGHVRYLWRREMPGGADEHQRVWGVG